MTRRRGRARRLVMLTTLALGCPAPSGTDGGGPQPVKVPAGDEEGANGGAADEDAAADDGTPLSRDPSSIVITTARSPAEVRAKGNQLAGEPSPYLQQHAHNPVDWYPWGEEALNKAKKERKPIFLSIGYSTCHWCHVMEKESFENDEVATYLNENFVSIKVDRERRPDLDAIYIDAVAALGGSTGWPLTVFLTPDLEPFYGGTYYPPKASRGRPGFMDVLAEVRKSFREDGDSVARKGKAILQRVERQALGRVASPSALGVQHLDDAMLSLSRARDPVEGGFGSRQKFPNPPLLLAELRHTIRTGNADSRAHLVLTLEKMLAGGIRDHVGGSFHRYAVDNRWHLPHFEKMLYDNAQLAALYIEAGRTLGREDFVDVGRAVLDELLESWQGPDGGFVVGFDADDPGGEGHFYSWTPDELESVLGSREAELVASAFGVTARGDHDLDGRSVLHRRPWAELVRDLGQDEAALRQALQSALAKMKTARADRPPPARDGKQLVGWNGLAIMTLADAGRWLDEPRYLEAATRAAGFVVDGCFADGALVRGKLDGTALGHAVLEDYALAGLGLVRLHAATGDLKWLRGARDLMQAIREHYYDEERFVFLRTRPGEAPVPLPDMEDGVLPSGGTAAALLALELGAISGDKSLLTLGEGVLQRLASGSASRPFSAGFALVAIDHGSAAVREVVIAGANDDPVTRSLWAEVAPTTHARILPVRIGADGVDETTAKAFPALEGKRALKGEATAFVCQQGSCAAPTSDPTKLRAQLDEALRSAAG